MTSGSSDRLTDFSSPLFRFLSAIIFWTTLLLVIIINKLVFRLKVTGRSNLSAISKTGCFLISNHTLYLDPAIIAHAISPRRTLFSALQSTFKIPVIGKYIRFLGAFPIPENNGLGKIVKPIKEALDKGWLIHFFPEGELHHFSQDIDEFQNGVFFLAYLLNRPVIPIILILYPRTLFGFRINRYFIRVKAVIGEPIYAIKNPDSWHSKREAVEEMAAYTHKVMEELIKQEQSLARNKRRHFLRL